jgi:hypothetical protein
MNCSQFAFFCSQIAPSSLSCNFRMTFHIFDLLVTSYVHCSGNWECTSKSWNSASTIYWSVLSLAYDWSLTANFFLLIQTALLYGSGTSEVLDVGRRPFLCFYEVIAERYMQVPEDCKAILQLFVKLWSQSFASQIFALLFYLWVCSVF